MALLAGDIGGTNTRLAIISPEVGPRAPLAEATFPSARYPGLEAVANEFLSQAETRAGSPWQVDWAIFAVARPVLGGRVTATNLPWIIDEAELSRTLEIPFVRVINDVDLSLS